MLTAFDDADLAEAGYRAGVAETVALRATQAKAAGVDGIVCSPREVAALRALVGPDVLLVTPGVRPAGSAAGDQKRVATPAEAIRSGADMVVVGPADPRRVRPAGGSARHHRRDRRRLTRGAFAHGTDDAGADARGDATSPQIGALRKAMIAARSSGELMPPNGFMPWPGATASGFSMKRSRVASSKVTAPSARAEE